ncbi:hypothetical protein ZIOFF_047278 [Zingiber officinale]|uniref:Uncharacterized protein n=1 Tax=Zingiber officinale TaxID=94328 RepID=A0A8J5FP84_ZINOF|nr:hypothetical protein ZIOFF_047278 [Zingiber officinale]
MSFYLRLEVRQSDDGIFVGQQVYVKEVLDRFNMSNGKPVATPMEARAKLSKDEEGEKVDPTLFKSLVGCLSDFARDIDDRKSITGFVFFMGTNAISWSSKKQAIVTLSSYEAEYIEGVLINDSNNDNFTKHAYVGKAKTLVSLLIAYAKA